MLLLQLLQYCVNAQGGAHLDVHRIKHNDVFLKCVVVGVSPLGAPPVGVQISRLPLMRLVQIAFRSDNMLRHLPCSTCQCAGCAC
jgi:hypothetical protein